MNPIDLTYSGYSQPTNFYLAGGFGQFNIYKEILLLAENFPILKDNAKIAGVYGAPPMAIWNGGRTEHINQPMSFKDCEYVSHFYNEVGVKFRLTFTNPLLKKSDFHDVFCNELLKIFANQGHEIIINNPDLQKYIEDKYPDAFTFVSSTTKPITKKIIDELKKPYAMVVLNYNLNHDMDFLKTIPEEDRCRVELLANEWCCANCPNRAMHYKTIGNEILFNRNPAIKSSEEIEAACPRFNSLVVDGKMLTDADWFAKTNYIYNNQINNYLDLGFNNFKLAGRNEPGERNIPRLFEYILNYDYFYKLGEQLYEVCHAPINNN